MDKYTDQQLLVRITNKDQSAFKVLYNRYENLIYSFAHQILRDRSLTMEAMQMVFLRLWNKAELYNPEKGRFSSWLLTVTRRICFDLIRQKRKQQDILTSPESLEWQIDQKSMSNGLDLMEMREWVTQAMAQLTANQQEVIQLAYWQGFSLSQISEQLQIPIGTVKSRLHQALLTLRRHLDDNKKERK